MRGRLGAIVLGLGILAAPAAAEEDLQDQLGHLTDGAVASTLLAQLGPIGGKQGYAIGLVRGFVASDMGHNRQSLERDWKRFRKLAPFWK